MPLCHVRQLGRSDGPAVWIMHGLLGMSDNWHSIARALAAEYEVFLPDMRNHGRSFHASVHSYAAMAEDILALMDAQGQASAYFVGHSMGGKVAMHLALRHSVRVLGICVVDMALRAYPLADNQAVLNAMARAPLASYVRRAQLDEALQVDFPNPAMRGFIMKNLYRDPKGHWAWRPNVAALQTSLPALSAAIDADDACFEGPVLSLRGEKSNYVSNDDLRDLKRHFPALQTEALATGHWVHAEAPQQSTDIIQRWLKQHTTT